MPQDLPAENLLRHETSPYLLQHAENPVHWRAWGPAALAEAVATDRPILLSVGYAACHWCHVMAHESFENDAIAAVMNELFVNIKVDREERPDLDTIYQSSLAMFGGQGGWPLTMFCTPDGKPFWGGTYFPPEPRHGSPAFPEILRHVARIYETERDKVDSNTDAILHALANLSTPSAGGALGPRVIEDAAAAFAQETDRQLGGIGGAPKFPHVPVFRLMWQGARRAKSADICDAVTTTLDGMAQGGIYDHLAGGFARYSTDSAWLAPHFEKMLYDNAQLIDLYTDAWLGAKNPLYAERVQQTVEWLLRDMQSIAAMDCNSESITCGGFYATLDADSEGIEGKYYVWDEAEIDALLGEQSTLFKQAYDVTAQGNWEAKTILNRSADPALKAAEDEAMLAAARPILLKARENRIPPALDDKILADWNGLAIAALARASMVFGKPDWLNAARAAFQFVISFMADAAEPDRLHHSWRNGEARHIATLDDYANMCRAAMMLFEATGDIAFIDRTRSWVETLEKRYWDVEGGGYFFTADDTRDVISRTKNAHDNPTPAGNGTMVDVLARLYYLTGADAWRARAETLISAFSGEVAKNAFPYATLIVNAAMLTEAVQVVVVGERGDPATDALVDAAMSEYIPGLILAVIGADATLPDGHPATGKGQVDGKPAAYICIGPTCSPPVSDPDAVVAELVQAT